MKKKFVTSLALVAVGSLLMAGSAFATQYYYADDMIAFPGYENPAFPLDQYGNPQIQGMMVEINGGVLNRVEIYETNRDVFDSLFINTTFDGTIADWHNWDFYVYDQSGGYHDVGRTLGIAEGLYSVDQNYTYTTASHVRTGHPNGIVGADLNFISALTPVWIDKFNADGINDTLVYDFSNTQILMGDSFSIAYAPWCANDVIGTPVPEPATMLLFGTGLVGAAGAARRRRNKK